MRRIASVTVAALLLSAWACGGEKGKEPSTPSTPGIDATASPNVAPRNASSAVADAGPWLQPGVNGVDPLCALGMAKHVVDNCGCDPVQVEFERRLKQTQLTEAIKKSTRTCMNGGLSGASAPSASGAYMVTCVEKTVVIAPEIRESLMKLVDDSTTGVLADDAGRERVATYHGCYKKWITSGNYALVLERRDEMAKALASLLLDTYLCNWMRIGVDMANVGCGPTPSRACSPFELFALYSLTVGDLLDSHHRSLCEGFRAGANVFLKQVPDANQFCVTRTPWLAAHEDTEYFEVLSGMNGKSSTDQVSLLKDMLYRRVPDENRDQAVQDIVAAWPDVNLASLGPAKQRWTDIKAQCGSTLCEVQIGGNIVSSAASWDHAQRVLFEAWLDFFSSTRVPGMKLGCAKDSMTWNGTKWKYRQGATCAGSACLQFGRPLRTSSGVAAFVKSLGGRE